ncbi:MAG: ATP-binding protein [bacterium]|nr:ATP-binding protein [bacterium]
MKKSLAYKIDQSTKFNEINFDKIEADLKYLNYDEISINKVILISEELVTNILKYAHNKNDINLALNFSSSSLILNIEDYGREFNPIKAKAPTQIQSIENAKVGGLGLHITKTITDSIKYFRVNGHNIIQATLSLEKNQRKTA